MGVCEVKIRDYQGFFVNLRFSKSNNMANHASAIKRIRQTAVRRLRNRYQLKTTKTMIKRLKSLSVAEEARQMLPSVISRIDKLAKKHIIHVNKAARQKSQLARQVASLAA
jgi:small subunit ribosomal protein S20